jgi:hypothetical protein
VVNWEWKIMLKLAYFFERLSEANREKKEDNGSN